MMTISGQEQDPSSVDDDDGCWVGLGEEKYWGAGNPSQREERDINVEKGLSGIIYIHEEGLNSQSASTVAVTRNRKRSGINRDELIMLVSQL